MKENKETYITFLISELEKGAERGETLSKFVEKWQKTPRTFDRLWKIAKERHKETQEKAQKAIADLTIAAAEGRQKTAIIDKQRRMEIASSIAEGKAWRVQNGQSAEIVIPSANDRIKALDYLSRIDGDYKPTKVANTDPEGNELPPPAPQIIINNEGPPLASSEDQVTIPDDHSAAT